jgi:hypothetical protein
VRRYCKPSVQAAAKLRGGGAMNSGPIGSLIIALRMRSISALAGASSHNPLTSWTGCSWIRAAQIVAFEFAVRPHPAGEESSAQRAVAKGRDLVLEGIGQGAGLDAALEKIIGRLQHMQRQRRGTAPFVRPKSC